MQRQRGVSQVLAVLLTLCTAVALLHVSIALGAPAQFGDSPRTTQIVRSYYASLNSFLADGDLADLDQLIAGRASEANLDDIALTFGALRATYPHLRLEPGEISGSAELALAQVSAVDGESALPTWINDGVGQTFPSSIDSLRIENGQVIQPQSSARVGVLALPLGGAGVDFRLDRPSHFLVAELVLSAPDPSSGFVAISGPGILMPVEGSFVVEGNGVTQVMDTLHGTARIIPSGETAVVAGQQILIIPRDRAVIRPASGSRPRMAYMAMIPAHPGSRDLEAREGPRGPESLEDVLRRLSTDDSKERIWFGAVRLLASAQEMMEPGWLFMDATRIVVPAGEAVRLSPRDYQLIAMIRADSAWAELDTFETTNLSNSIWMLDVFRACWRGTGYQPLVACAAQPAGSG
jgi:hypothetical protein